MATGSSQIHTPSSQRCGVSPKQTTVRRRLPKPQHTIRAVVLQTFSTASRARESNNGNNCYYLYMAPGPSPASYQTLWIPHKRQTARLMAAAVPQAVRQDLRDGRVGFDSPPPATHSFPSRGQSQALQAHRGWALPTAVCWGEPIPLKGRNCIRSIRQPLSRRMVRLGPFSAMQHVI